MSNLNPAELARVTKFVTELQKLSDKTGVTIFANQGNAQLQVDETCYGLYLEDGDASAYRIEIRGE